MNTLNFKNIFDKYCPLLYSVALQICNSKMKAEKVLINVFKKIYNQDISQHTDSIYSITLMRLIIKSAQELYSIKLKSNFRLKQFQNTPLLNQLICNQISLQDYCKQKYLTHQEVLHIIRKEFIIIRNGIKENAFLADHAIFTFNVPANKRHQN